MAEPLVLRFTVLGKPVTKRRARGSYNPFTKKMTFRSDPHTKTWEKFVGWEAVHAINLLREQGIEWPTDRIYESNCTFYVTDKRTRDTENLQKAVLDGCNKIVYRDDSQAKRNVSDCFVDKEQPRVEVVFTVIEGR